LQPLTHPPLAERCPAVTTPGPTPARCPAGQDLCCWRRTEPLGVAMTSTDAPLVIVSSDTHIGPKLVEQLRPYCPSAYLDDFDAFAEQTAAMRSMFRQLADGDSPLSRNARTEGHHDVHARLRDLDADG